MEAIDEYANSPYPKILDVGCGTGTILSHLLTKGYDVQGIDRSENMLAVAQHKLNKQGFHPLLLCQDMRYLELTSSYEVIYLFCDTLNYLVTEEDILQAFRSCYQHLDEGGLLVFDVHSMNYVENTLQGVSFADAAENVSYIWNTFAGQARGEVEQELTFFVEREEALYERFDEYHLQRTFPVEHYKAWLSESSFITLGVFADFSFHPPDEDSDRVFFVAKKLSNHKKKGYNKKTGNPSFYKR